MSVASEPVNKEELERVFHLQSEHQWTVRRSGTEQRIAKLEKLRAAIQAHEQEARDALYNDLRKPGEGDLNAVYTELNSAIANLKDWMAPVIVEPSEMFVGSEAKMIYEPRGVVLLFGPWNYPFNLVFQPLVPILAAGNCAIIKPNEMAPATSAVTAKIIREAFDEKEVCVFEGGVDLANQLLELPVDHIFFTGSPAVGKLVMSAAAKHLASVTLELGGKNPVIIDRDANIQEAAGKIAVFRNVNSGQVCLCPENVWVHEDSKEEFLAVVQATYQAKYFKDGELDIEAQGKFVDQRNLSRVKAYVDDAVEKGAQLVCGGEVIEETLSMHPTILTDVPDDARILSEEVFGPVLSVFTYEDVSEVYSTLHKQPKPLAIYIFSDNDDFVEDVLAHTTSGGVTVNNCMMHCVEERLPFGGVNHSGTGSYHGVYGFKELSHERAILKMP